MNRMYSKRSCNVLFLDLSSTHREDRHSFLKPASSLAIKRNWKVSPGLRLSTVGALSGSEAIQVNLRHSPSSEHASTTYTSTREPPSSNGFFHLSVTDFSSLSSTLTIRPLCHPLHYRKKHLIKVLITSITEM